MRNDSSPTLASLAGVVLTLLCIAAGVALVAAKLFGLILWPWWIVTAPIWGWAAVVGALFAAIMLRDRR